MNQSRVIHCENYHWKSVPKREYKKNSNSYKDISRYSLLGDEEKALNIQTRYFEIQPGGYSSLEYHRHPHSVIIIRGSGTVVLGDELFDIGLHDVIFVSPETLHQFHADKEEPLGFICIVDRYRDRPTLPDDNYISTHILKQDVIDKIKR